jgi:inhibitor of KinA sporulation pathway (predicted exonuclease)
MKIKHVLAGAALVLAMGCGKKGGGSADIEAFMKLDTDKATAFAAGGDNCDEKAKSVGEWRTKNTANYKAMQKKLNEQWPKGPPEDVKTKYGDQMKKNKTAVMDAMMACTGKPAFDKMMDDTKAAEEK